jgi:hypothetical protein
MTTAVRLDEARPAAVRTDTLLSRRSARTVFVADARLRLRPPVPVAGTETADGVWWPRSLDLVAELSSLLASMGSAGRAVRRVTYNLDAWLPAPRKADFNGVPVRLGGYRMLSPRVLHLSSSHANAPVVLLVIPPSADAGVAAAALGNGNS